MNGVLVDTSVWVDHFRNRNEDLVNLADTGPGLVPSADRDRARLRHATGAAAPHLGRCRDIDSSVSGDAG